MPSRSPCESRGEDTTLAEAKHAPEQAITASLTEELLRSYEELSLWYELGERLSSTYDVEGILAFVLEKAVQLLEGASGVIMLLDPAQAQLVTKVRYPAAVGPSFGLTIDQGIAGQVLRANKGAIIGDVGGDPHFIADGLTTHDLICTPIRAGGNPLGVLKVSDKQGGRTFTAHDLKLLTTLAFQTGLFIENALTHRARVEAEVQEREDLHAQELESLSQGFEWDVEMVRGFIEEARELLATMGGQVVRLEEEGCERALLDDLFRGMHTLKGTARFFGFQPVSELAHAIEDLFDLLRTDGQPLTPELTEGILKGMGSLEDLIEAIAGGQGEQASEWSALVNELRQLRSATAMIPNIGAVREPPLPPVAEAGKKPDGDFSVRISIEKLNILTAAIEQLNNLSLSVSQGAEQTQSLYERIQLQLMSLRKVPVKHLFAPVPAMVRTLAAKVGKQVHVSLSGDEVEIDKTLLDELTGPLIHLVRNAVDHGVESSEERSEQGKPAAGRLELRAWEDGNEVSITVRDDGRGLDPATLRAAAIAKGQLEPVAAQQLSDQAALELIFAPGFSTAASVTDLSGRGVGLNVVQESLHKLNGQLLLDSALGQGTTFTLCVPATLGILSVLVVEVGDATYAIPLSHIREVTLVETGSLHRVGGLEGMLWRGNLLPLVRLAKVLGVAAARRQGGNGAQRVTVVVVRERETEVGLVVDGVEGKREVLTKPLDGLVARSPYIAGGAIVGDRVLFILKVSRLLGAHTV